MILNFVIAEACFAADSNPSSSTGGRLYSSIILTTNAIDEGISTSADGWAIAPEVGYKSSGWKAGVFGTNVQYPDNSESLDLRPLISGEIHFTTEIMVTAQFQFNVYSKSTARNGYSAFLDTAISGHHIVLREDSNFYGTGTADYWLEYHKLWKAFWGLEYYLQLGYLVSSSIYYTSYFAGKTGFEYINQNFSLALLVAYNGGASQFNELSMPVYLEFMATF